MILETGLEKSVGNMPSSSFVTSSFHSHTKGLIMQAKRGGGSMRSATLLEKRQSNDSRKKKEETGNLPILIDFFDAVRQLSPAYERSGFSFIRKRKQ